MAFMHGKQFLHPKPILFFLFLSLIAIVGYWQVLSFTFSKDDWGLLWGSLYDGSIYHWYTIHPATPIEFFVLSHIFGTNPIYWQLFGILLRVLLGFIAGKVMFALTNSKKTAIVASIFVVTSYAGIESIHFVSAHATALSFVFLFSSIYFWMQYILKKSKNLLSFFICSFIGFFLDPGRSLPIFLILPLLYMFFAKRIISFPKIKKYFVFFVPILIIVTTLFISWYMIESPGSQLSIFFIRFFHNPTIFFKKLYLVANYFCSIGNLVAGWIIPNMQDAQNTGVYSKVVARIGIVFFLLTVFAAYCAFRYRKIQWKMIAFLLLWIFLWYMPDWLFEPRVPMAGSHRYLLISGIGLSLLLAYVISLVKNKYIFLLLTLFVIVANVATIHRILAYQATFRSVSAFQSVWGRVNKDVAPGLTTNIFVFEGKEPYLDLIARLSGAIPFALARSVSNQQYIPMVLEDPNQILQYLCKTNIEQFGRTRPIIQKEKISLSHVYAWTIISPTKITSFTMSERATLRADAKMRGCSL